VHVVPTTAQAGAETRARELLMGLAERGEFDLELVYLEPGLAHDRFVGLGIPMHQLRPLARYALDFPRLSWRLRRLYRDRSPAIVHTWLPHGNIAGLLAFRRRSDVQLVVTQCGGRGEEVFYPRQIQVQRKLIGRADHAISNSSDGVDALKRWGVPAEQVSLILNGISRERVSTTRTAAEVRNELGVGTGDPLVVSATRVNDRAAAEQKDIDGLLEAMARVRELHPAAMLALVGPSREQLAGAGIDLPDRARATGFVPRPADYLNAGNVVAISSRSEGMSNVACEALMLGRPVVTTQVGDHVAIVEAAGGRSVPVAHPEQLAASIAALIQTPPSPETVRTIAEGTLSLERMVDETSAVYERLLAYHS
jgi:glycosyltransferase involved in cell wall biosynthesis